MKNLILKIYSGILKFKKSQLFLLLIGLVSLIWFLLRVIPKPQRASYPCQRAAFPVASLFVIWVSGFFASHKLFVKAKQAFKTRLDFKGTLIMVCAIIIFVISLFFIQLTNSVTSAITQFKINSLGNELLVQEKFKNSEDIITAKAVVGIARSKKASASEIQFDEIDSLIRKSVELAGGFDTLVHEGDTVVIKPNVIASKDQKPGSYKTFPMEANGIATDYRLIQVVVNMVREKNSTGKIYIIEGSGYGNTRVNMNAIGYNKITGIDSIMSLDEQPGNWYDKSSPEIVKVSLPTGKNLYSNTNEYFLNKIYAHAQVLISLPCLKTHFLTGVTGSIKNVGIGATPVKIYGNGPSAAVDDQPGRWNHISHGDFATTTVSLDKWIHDFYMCRPVDYVIMDGLQGAQYGPYPSSNNDGRVLADVQMNMRVILAGKDPLAVDAIEALSIGVDPYKVGHLVYLAKDTVGCINPAYIKVRGAQVAEFKKLFGELAPGNKCLYTDVASPVVSLSNLKFENNLLSLALSPTEEIAKVEIAYNDTILEPIVINNFATIQFPINNQNFNEDNVTVLVYDKYLNCSKLSKKHPSFIKSAVYKEIDIYPNPASTYINIKNPFDNNTKVTYNIMSLTGQVIDKGNFTASISIENLKAGHYYLKVSDGSEIYNAQFMKK